MTLHPFAESRVSRAASTRSFVLVLLLVAMPLASAWAQTATTAQANLAALDAWIAAMSAPLSGNREADLARLSKAKLDATNSSFLAAFPDVKGPFLQHLDWISTNVQNTTGGQAYPQGVHDSSGQIANMCKWMRDQLTGTTTQSPAAAQTTATGSTVPLDANGNPVTNTGTASTGTASTGTASTGSSTADSPITLGGVSLEQPGATNNPASPTNTSGPPVSTPTLATGGTVPTLDGVTNTQPTVSSNGAVTLPGAIQPNTGTASSTVFSPTSQALPTGFLPTNTNQQMMALISQILAQMGGSIEVVNQGVSSTDPNMATVTIRIRPNGSTASTGIPSYTGLPSYTTVPTYTPGQTYTTGQPYTTSNPVVTSNGSPTVTQPQVTSDQQQRAAATRAAMLQQLSVMDQFRQLVADDKLVGGGLFAVEQYSWTGPRGQTRVNYTVKTRPEALAQIEQIRAKLMSEPLRSRFLNETNAINTKLADFSYRVWAQYSGSSNEQNVATAQAAQQIQSLRREVEALLADLQQKIQSV